MISKKLSLAIFVMFFITALFSANSLLAVDNTVLYLQGEGTTIKDTSGKNYQITVNGNATISTTQKKFGNSSIYFDGSGDYLTVPISNDWFFGSENFTIDFWFKTNSQSAQGFTNRWTGCSGCTNDSFLTRIYSGNLQAYLAIGGTMVTITTSNMNYADGNWHHFAMVRNVNVLYLFGDGVKKAEVSLSGAVSNGSQILEIGRYTGGSSDFLGYLDEIRITKGQALWTANFTPPSALPTVNFSASKDLINYGESVTFNWSTIDASGCTLQYNNTTQVVQIPSGTLTLSPNAPTTYTLIATGPGGTTYKEINVKVLNGYTTTGPFTVATKVGVGVMNPVNALEVNGTIKAKEVQVTLNNWPDYVFSQSYDLRSLQQLEAFIQKNGRLPEMPSAQELESQGGSVAEILKKQMQKIEELTLYILQLQKQIEGLKKE